MNAVKAYAQTSGFRVSELTRPNDNYRYAIKPFARFLEFRGDTEVTLEAVRDYFRALNQSKLSASTVRNRRQAVKDRIRRQFAHAPAEMKRHSEIQLEEIDRDPETKCPASSFRNVTSEQIISEADYVKLLEQCRSTKQRLFIEFLFRTGARVSEMTGIRFEDLEHTGAVYVVRLRGKGNKNASYKERRVYAPERLVQAIINEFRGTEYIFETGGGKRYSRSYVSEQIAKQTKRVLGRRLSAHKLRHSFATIQLQKHGRLTAVSQYLGHSDIAITAKYYAHDSLSASDVLGQEALQ